MSLIRPTLTHCNSDFLSDKNYQRFKMTTKHENLNMKADRESFKLSESKGHPQKHWCFFLLMETI
jgi:hypothetical protein